MDRYHNKQSGDRQDSFRRPPSNNPFSSQFEGSFSPDDQANPYTYYPPENGLQSSGGDPRGYSITSTSTTEFRISYPECDLSAFPQYFNDDPYTIEHPPCPVTTPGASHYGNPNNTVSQVPHTMTKNSEQFALTHLQDYLTSSNPDGRMEPTNSLRLHNTPHTSVNLEPSIYTRVHPPPPGWQSASPLNPLDSTWETPPLTQNYAVGLPTFPSHLVGMTPGPNVISHATSAQHVQENFVPDPNAQLMHPIITQESRQVRRGKGSSLVDLPRDDNGPLRTRELERVCLPPGDECIKRADGKIRCQIMASVSPKGLATWERFSQRCDIIFTNIDNYRKHLKQQHLGCPRQEGKTQGDVLEERYEEAKRGMVRQVLRELTE